jgi:phosphatidate cytidylyltransferase
VSDTIVIPYRSEPHPLTGVTSGKLGIWIFLASEVMLFGALFSSYVLLRVGTAAENWPQGIEAGLNVPIGTMNTLILITSSVTMVMSWASLKMDKFDNFKRYLGATIALGALFLMLSVLFRAGPVDDAGRAAGLLVLGVTWIPGFLVALPLLRRMDHGLAWIFFMLAVTWLGDTGAYFAGRTFGKHKLYEKISPKKTWEGAIGGAVTAVIGALIVRAIGLPESDLLLCIVLALVLDAAGIVGDLTESMIKRTFGVKDSGRIMPGHGGILDRVDSLLFTSPVLFYALQLMGH